MIKNLYGLNVYFRKNMQWLLLWFRFMLIIWFLLSRKRLYSHKTTIIIFIVTNHYLQKSLSPFLYAICLYFSNESIEYWTPFKTFEKVSEKFKYFLYKYYPRFVKAYKSRSNFLFNRLDIRQFFVLLYDCAPNMKHVWNIGKLLKNANALQVGTGKNSISL